MKKKPALSYGNKDVAAEAFSTTNKKRGGGLSFDNAKAKNQIVKKASGGGVGSDKSPFSSAGGGKASTSPFSSACRKG